MKMIKKPTNLFSAVLGLLVTIALIWAGYYLITSFVGFLAAIDKQVAATIIATSLTALGAVAAALYAQKKTKEREIFEAHRSKKVETYDKFMKVLIDVFRSSL